MCIVFYSYPVVFVFSNTPSREDHQIGVGNLNVGYTQFESASLNSMKCGTAEMRTCLESRTNKSTRGSRTTDGDEICLNSKWITDVDRVHVTEEKRKQMMRKARAISRAISNRAANSGNGLPAARSLEHTVCVSVSESRSQNDSVRTAVKTDVDANSGTKFGWRIPRVQNVPTITGSAGAGGNRPSPASKVAPPLPRDISSSFRSHGRGRKTDRSRKFGEETLHQPSASQDDKTKIAAVTLSPMLLPTPSQRATADMVEERTVDGLRVGAAAEVAADTLQTAAGRLLCPDSYPNLLPVPSHELLEKAKSSSIRKSAILIPNAVPARGERGTAVSVLVPTQKNLNLNQRTAQLDSPAKITSTSVPSSSCISPGQSAAAKKRKLNISQYKSILPQRQKTMPPAAAVARRAELPTVRMYGRCRDILHDHDYVSGVERGSGCNKESSVEQASTLPSNVVETEVATVTDAASEVTATAVDTAESMQDGTKRDTVTDVSVSENTSGNIAPCVIASRLKAAAPSLSAASEFRAEPTLESKVTTSKKSASAYGIEDKAVDCLPAYFDVVSLPNRQTKISVSAATLVTKKKLNPQLCVTTAVRDSTKQSSEYPNDKSRSCDTDVGLDTESRRSSVIPRLDLETVTNKDRFSSRSNSVSSAVSISSDDESSRSTSRSSGRRCSTSESSCSSDSGSENFHIFLLPFILFVII